MGQTLRGAVAAAVAMLAAVAIHALNPSAVGARRALDLPLTLTLLTLGAIVALPGARGGHARSTLSW